MSGNAGKTFTIVHLSDLHCGSPYFLPELLQTAIDEINALDADMVIVSGDLTNEGFRQEYELALGYLDELTAPEMIVVPGNHDSRNVGYVHFEDLFGSRRRRLRLGGIAVVAVDSSQPDVDHGSVGRGLYRWIEEGFAEPADLKIFVLHHHLLPVPGTGRERNVVHDAGDALECLQRAGVNLVLSGHKHVPYAWRLEDLFVVNTGTVSTLRTRGRTGPCYLTITGDRDRVVVTRCHPGDGGEELLSFSPHSGEYSKSAFLLGQNLGTGLDR